jgi:TPP-dependent pyruvate/acetoin dehydrogenase alpha subunit
MVSPVSHLGGLVPVLAGMALAARLQGRRRVALTWVGEGATSTGEFHEGMCFAAARSCPLVVIIENNGYAYTTPSQKQSAIRSFAQRARAYGVPAESVDGNDVEAVHAATSRAVERARDGAGPSLIEARTFRMSGHAQHDDQRYVPRELLEHWSRRDPVARLESRLDEADLRLIDEEIGREVDAAAERALAARQPDPDSVTSGVYGEPPGR